MGQHPKPLSHSRKGTDCSWERGYRAQLITAAEWDKHRDIFTKLYLDDGLSLTQVRKTMAEEHNFYGSETQFKNRRQKWGIGKNLKKETVSAMLRIQDRRALEEGKSTEFRYKGKIIEGNNLERRKQRQGHASGKGQEPLAATPPHLKYYTPSPKTSELGIPSEHDSEKDDDIANAISTSVNDLRRSSCSPQSLPNPPRNPVSITKGFLEANSEGLPCEQVTGVNLVSGSRSRGLLNKNLRSIKDVDHCGESVKGSVVSTPQHGQTPMSDISRPKEVTSGEIEQSLSDIAWKNPKQGGTSTIESWIRDE